jgi:hypothetical protein
MAESLISKQVKDSVQYYLGETNFEKASTWMDEIRDNHSYDFLKPTHYINIEKDKTYVKVDGANIMNEIDIFLALLEKKKDKESVLYALRILFHLIGDLHQPLHCGYADDRGGNTVEVIFNGKKTNLHKLWDSDIIEKYSEEIYPGVMFDIKKNKKVLTDPINTAEWLEQSRILLPAVYGFNNKEKEVDADYLKLAKPVIINRLAAASMRLASVLNMYFSV